MSRRIPVSPLAASLGLLLLGAGPAHACSKVPFGGRLSPAQAFLVGVATADTVRAGPGAVRYDHAGGDGRSIHGQVVRVERIGGPAGIRAGVVASRAVLVPWSYGPDCRPLPWPESARWIEPGARGLYMGELRDSAHWVGGMPTFDLHDPYMLPYPQRVPAAVLGGAGGAPGPLTADEMFSLYDALPHPERLAAAPAEAVRALQGWVRRNPGIASRWPAAGILSDAFAAAEAERIRGIASPLAGTYRFRLALTGVPDRVSYVRTALRPAHPWYLADRGESAPAAGPRRAGGYRILAVAAPSVAELARVQDPPRVSRGDEIRIVETPRETPDGGRVWRGAVEVRFLAAQLPPGPEVRRFLLDQRAEMGRRTEGGGTDQAPATFTLHPDGRLVVRQEVRLPDGRALVLEGERISAEVIPEPRTR